jgi:hypothetical protein
MNRKQTLQWLKIKRLERDYQSLTQWYESKLKQARERLK